MSGLVLVQMSTGFAFAGMLAVSSCITSITQIIFVVGLYLPMTCIQPCPVSWCSFELSCGGCLFLESLLRFMVLVGALLRLLVVT